MEHINRTNSAAKAALTLKLLQNQELFSVIILTGL